MYYKISKEDKNYKQGLSNVYNQVVKGKKGLKLIESVNNRSKANFVQRLNNSERQHIQDWENPNKIATHKMSWATEGEKAIVFPSGAILIFEASFKPKANCIQLLPLSVLL